MVNVSQLLNKVMSAAQTGASSTNSPPRSSLGSTLNSSLGSSLGSSIGSLLSNKNAINGVLAGVGGAGLMGALSGKNSSLRTVAGVGGAAALGTLAYQAYCKWQAKREPSSLQNKPLTSPQSQPLDFGSFPQAVQEDQEEKSRMILKAMVAAAKADGQFDESEKKVILEETQKAGDVETTAWVQQEINKPLNIDEIALMATSPQLASEIYIASMLVIQEPNSLEIQYLDLLSSKMRLDPDLRKEIEQQLAA